MVLYISTIGHEDSSGSGESVVVKILNEQDVRVLGPASMVVYLMYLLCRVLNKSVQPH